MTTPAYTPEMVAEYELRKARAERIRTAAIAAHEAAVRAIVFAPGTVVHLEHAKRGEFMKVVEMTPKALYIKAERHYKTVATVRVVRVAKEALAEVRALVPAYEFFRAAAEKLEV